MRKMNVIAGAAAALLLTASTAFGEVKVSLQNGRVSIVAADATLRQILTEWARVGQTKIVNVERIPGGPMTLELTNMPEQQALDLLLRSVSGFMVAVRPTAVGNLSQFDRIMVMPTSVAPRQALSPQPATPTFQQPQYTMPQPQPTDDDVDDERPAQMPTGGVPNPRGPVFNTFPQPQVVNPQVQMPPVAFPGAPPQQQMPQQQPGAYPTAPFGGVTTPGMIVQPPQQPGQPGQMQPGMPGQPVRRPGAPDGR